MSDRVFASGQCFHHWKKDAQDCEREHLEYVDVAYLHGKNARIASLEAENAGLKSLRETEHVLMDAAKAYIANMEAEKKNLTSYAAVLKKREGELEKENAALREAQSTAPTPDEILQWAIATFGTLADRSTERTRRFIEEAIELGQACDLPSDDVAAITERVYSRPNTREIHKETGQAVMTLYALCAYHKIDPSDALVREWRRVKTIPSEEWERRHNAKADLGIATRMAPPEEQK